MAGRKSVKIDADVHRAALAVAKWRNIPGGVQEYISRKVAEAVRADLEAMARQAKEVANALKGWDAASGLFADQDEDEAEEGTDGGKKAAPEKK
jgi:hypothetical protein